MGLIYGGAAARETAVFAQQFPDLAYQMLPFAGWHVSQAGFGGYRVDVANQPERDALALALQSGINVIDTSSNYADGGSEQLVGRVVGELVAAGTVRRGQLVVVSKAGYLQGQNYALSQQRRAAGTPFPELVEYADGLEHCIHPEFLEDQLTRSLERLNMTTIDVYLLHNPEYYLGWAQQQGVGLNQARQTYYERIYRAFAHLETEVARGRIQAYGVSSNSFPSPSADPQFTSLELLWQLAERLSPQHHFRVVQMPMNLLETGAVTEHNNSGRSALEFAREKGLAVLINRPLNAYRLNALTRLAAVEPGGVVGETAVSPAELSTSVDTLVRLEQQFATDFWPELPFSEQIRRNLRAFLAVGQQLQGRWAGFGTHQNWLHVRGEVLLPRCQSAVQYLANWEAAPPALLGWLAQYVAQVNMMLQQVTAFYQEQAAEQAAQLWQTAVSCDPDWAAESLSQTAVRALRSTAGVTTVLVGMRKRPYVADVLADLRRPVAVQDRMGAWQKLAT